jgi:hypothetical protein
MSDREEPYKESKIESGQCFLKSSQLLDNFQDRVNKKMETTDASGLKK